MKTLTDGGHNTNRERVVTVTIYQKVVSQSFVEFAVIQQQTLLAPSLHRNNNVNKILCYIK